MTATSPTLLKPATVSEAVDAMRSAPRVIAVGAGTKPRLSAVDAIKIFTTSLRGIVEYEPSEFTFTALAGTPVREIAAALAERGQYLPFDPMFVEAGATLGGTLASGVSGAGRFRFGGLRDFILGVQFVDGAGRLLRMGGKVVKNAAGFDLPKFFSGSLGRFGFIVEVTFKVFPRSAGQLTLKLEASSPETAVQIITAASKARWELDTLDYLPDEPALALRLAGPPTALPSLAQEILARWPGRSLPEAEADALWRRLRECTWVQPEAANRLKPELHATAPGNTHGVPASAGTSDALSQPALIKAALSPGHLALLTRGVQALDGTRMHVSAGGNVAFISAPAEQLVPLDQLLREHGLTGVMLRGEGPLWLGKIDRSKITDAVKKALDVENRFPSLYD